MKKITFIILGVLLLVSLTGGIYIYSFPKKYTLGKDAFCINDKNICVDKNKKPITGILTLFYDNVKFVTDYKEGIRNGKSKAYLEDGNLKEEVSYENGEIVGIARRYYETGELRQEANFVDSALNGIEREYYENGNLKSELFYKDNKIDGIAKDYYETGELQKEYFYKNGVQNGPSKFYYKNGNLQEEATFENNEMVGVLKGYLDTGELNYEQNFFDNYNKNGFLKEYYTNGKIKEEKNWLNDELNGEHKIYREDGSLSYIAQYKAPNEKAISTKYFDKNGKQIKAEDMDCYQATEEAKKRRNEIGGKPGALVLLSKASTVNPEGKIVYAENLNLKVVDFAHDGLIVSTSCSGTYAASMFFGELGALAAMSCQETRFFIYTEDQEYATGDSFRTKDLLYGDAGFYKYTTIIGGTNSIKAYRETQYKVSEIEYKTYLVNKSLKCCNIGDSTNIKSCNGER